jgi:Mg2+ and Co2+ transporter CorA
VIKTYKEQVEQLKDQITTFQKQIDTMQKDVNQMQAVIGEKEKQNKDLRDLLLARNPHVEQFYTEALPILENMKIFMARLDTYLKDTSVQAHKQTDELQTQTDLLKKIA